MNSEFNLPEVSAYVKDAENEITILRSQLAEAKRLLIATRPHITGNTGEWRHMLDNKNISAAARQAATEAIAAGDTLLQEIDGFCSHVRGER